MSNGWAGIALVGLVFWLARQMKRPGDGPALLGGNVGDVQVTMSTHAIAKFPGDVVTIIILYNPLTTNVKGEPVKWAYRVECRVGHNTALGWRTAGDNIPNFGNTTWPMVSARVSEHRDVLGTPQAERFIVTAPFDPDQVWDVRVKLFAAQSNQQGNIAEPLTWVELGPEFEHPSAIRTGPFESAIGGNIGDVLVSQAQEFYPQDYL